MPRRTAPYATALLLLTGCRELNSSTTCAPSEVTTLADNQEASFGMSPADLLADALGVDHVEVVLPDGSVEELEISVARGEGPAEQVFTTVDRRRGMFAANYAMDVPCPVSLHVPLDLELVSDGGSVDVVVHGSLSYIFDGAPPNGEEYLVPTFTGSLDKAQVAALPAPVVNDPAEMERTELSTWATFQDGATEGAVEWKGLFTMDDGRPAYRGEELVSWSTEPTKR